MLQVRGRTKHVNGKWEFEASAKHVWGKRGGKWEGECRVPLVCVMSRCVLNALPLGVNSHCFRSCAGVRCVCKLMCVYCVLSVDTCR